MLQRWHEITFLHWSCDPRCLTRHLPTGLKPDLFDGKAWISLTPFLLTGLRPPFSPRWLGMDFPEMNLRTYVIGDKGPGIWFFSLDAAKLSPVIGARTAFGLPYYWASMRMDIGDTQNTYTTRRNDRTHAVITVVKQSAIERQSDLDVFLTARFRLYAVWARRLITVQVQHPAWVLRQVNVVDLDENVRRTMNVEFPHDSFLAHHSIGVDTRIGRPTWA
jgi:uncharacterized protein YqjF (DUF2071 family)